MILALGLFLSPTKGFSEDLVHQYDQDLLEEFNQPGLEVSLKGNKTKKQLEDPIIPIARQPASSDKDFQVSLHYVKK